MIKLAKRYRNLGIPFVDLIQEGNIGLLRAVEKFDPSRGFRFSTYAVWWIEQAMIRAVQNQSRTVRLPSHMYDQQLRLRRTEESLRSRIGAEPRREDLARALSVSGERVDQIRSTLRPLKSLESPVAEDDGITLKDLLAEDAEGDWLGETDREKLRRALQRGLRILSDRERTVLECRYGLRGDDEMTLQQIGDRIDLSRERVRQIEANALARLRVRKELSACAEELGAAGE